MNILKLVFGVAVLLAACFPGAAQQVTNLTITVKNQRFQPAEVHAPARVPIELRVKNLDPSRMEFESDKLRAEKIINGNSEAVIRLQPLSPGRYEFYDDFHQENSGVLIVK